MTVLTYLKLILVRHAQSIGNAQKIMEGQSSTPLSNQGIHQAQQLSATLHTEPALGPSVVYSSPSLRAVQTAEILTASLAQDSYQLSSDLQEIHQGIFQGLTWLEAQAQYPQLCHQLLNTRKWQPVPHAESPAAARNRANLWVDKIRHRHRPGEVIWAISHAGIMQQIVSVILGCDRTWKIPIHHTARFEFWLSQTYWQSSSTEPGTDLDADQFNPEHWIIHRFNDYSHLIS